MNIGFSRRQSRLYPPFNAMTAARTISTFFEDAAMNRLIFQRSGEALGNTVDRRLGNGGEARRGYSAPARRSGSEVRFHLKSVPKRIGAAAQPISHPQQFR
jgi:hypothetical protein